MHFRVKYIQVASTKYSREDVVVLGVHISEPVLGRIKEIYVLDDDQCVFIIRHLIVCFHPHYHAFEVVGTGDTIVTTPDKLLSYHPYNTYTCFSPSLSTTQFVCLKHHFM